MTNLFGKSILHLKQISYETFSGRFDFDLFDHNDQVLATVREPNQHLWKTVFRNAIGQEYRAKHFMHVDGMDGAPIFAIDKHNEMLTRSASVLLPNTGEIGRIKKVNLNPAKPHFRVVDAQDEVVADVPVIPFGVAVSTWNFQVLDPSGEEIAEILQSGRSSVMPPPYLRGYSTLRFKRKVEVPVRRLLVAAFVTISWFSQESRAT